MKTQFWAGNFKDKKVFNDFFEEVYTDNDEESISKFAQSQNENWIDHDFLEIGFEDTDNTNKEKFKKYSYAEKWIDIFENELIKKNILNVNAIIMMSYDNEYSQIDSPKSHKDEGLDIEYLGVIEY